MGSKEAKPLTKTTLEEFFTFENNELWRKEYINGRGVLLKKNKVSLSKNLDGYLYTTIKRKPILFHRIVYAWHYGELPQGMLIDHINGDRTDNRIENLKAVTRRENNHNRPYHRTGGLIGTTYDRRIKKWNAQIYINGKNKNLGYFETAELAHQAYMSVFLALEQ